MLLFGNNQIGPIYLGNNEVTSIYQGNELVYTASALITNYVTFTAQQANSTIGLQQLSSNQKLWYSIDGEQWEKMTTAITITLTNSGDNCYIAGMLGGNNTYSNFTQFKMTGNIAASGNCNYLWNYENPDAPLKEYCGNRIFQGCTSLTTAPELPATTLASDCYRSMFYGCSSLNYIKCLAVNGINQNNSTTDWVNGVASAGTFVKHHDVSESTWGRSVNGIPTNWTVEDAQ